MRTRPKINHLDRHGLEVHPDFNKKGHTVLGRRSRKIWECAADHECAVGMDIDLDEVYVEHLDGTSYYEGTTHRFHIACAIRRGVVVPVEKAINKNNGRRQAIAAQRARRSVDAG